LKFRARKRALLQEFLSLGTPVLAVFF